MLGLDNHLVDMHRELRCIPQSKLQLAGVVRRACMLPAPSVCAGGGRVCVLAAQQRERLSPRGMPSAPSHRMVQCAALCGGSCRGYSCGCRWPPRPTMPALHMPPMDPHSVCQLGVCMATPLVIAHIRASSRNPTRQPWLCLNQCSCVGGMGVSSQGSG